MDNYRTISKYGINKSASTNSGNNSGNPVISRFGFNRKFTSFNNGNNPVNPVVSRFGLNTPKYKEQNDILGVSVKNLVVGPKEIVYPPMIPFWTFDPANSTISSFTASTLNNTGITVDWSNSEMVDYDRNFITSKTITPANSSVSLRSRDPEDLIFAISIGTSNPKLKGDIDVSQFNGLTYLNVPNNDLDSLTGYDKIPNLITLQAFGNKLTNNIPSLDNNLQLETFRVETNLLTGSMPSLTDNIRLRTFYTFGNSLTGIIPPLDTNIILDSFRVNNNKLTGRIPSLSNNTLLEYFWCHSNQLSGNIPNLSNNTELISFNCGTNKLSGFDGGTIPPKLTNFQAASNILTVEAVDSILSAFEVMSNATGISGSIHVGNTGNAIPSISGYVKTTSAGTNFTRVGNLVTANVTNHGFTTGEIVTFTGLTPTQLQGTFIVNVINPNSFSFITTTTGDVTGAGTATMRKVTNPNCGYRIYQNLSLASRSGGAWSVTINQPA